MDKMDPVISLVGWSVATIIAIAVIIVGLTIYYALKGEKEKPITGRNAMEGEIGEARTDINPEGRVLVHGEWWNARADENIPEGSKVRVVSADKMLLKIERAPDDA